MAKTVSGTIVANVGVLSSRYTQQRPASAAKKEGTSTRTLISGTANAAKREIGKEGKFYASSGFNRGYHSKADTTFHTPDGHFTIHNAHGDDRPSKDFSSYFFSTKAQYNFRFGRYISDRWALEVGTDHLSG